MSSLSSEHSRTSSLTNNSGSTISISSSSPVTWTKKYKRYFLYVHKYPEPSLPTWILSPVFSELRQQILATFRERLECFVRLTQQLVVEERDVNLTWLGWEQSEDQLKEQLELSFPGAEVVREGNEWSLDEFWPKEFTDHVTIFSTPVEESWGETCKEQGVGGSGFWDADQNERMKENKLPKGKKNSRLWNKGWRCCRDECRAWNPSERRACKNGKKVPDCSHEHCEYCDGGGNYQADAVLD